MSPGPEGGGRPDRLDPPLAMHRAGEAALLADYPGTEEVLAAAAAVRELAPAQLIDLVPAERTLLLAGTAARDLPRFESLLRELPAPAAADGAGAEVSVGIVYDGEDLGEVAELLGMSTQALITAHSSARWTAAFGGFAPGFSYLLPAPAGPADADGAVGLPWEVPRRAEPRTAVPAGAVGLAARYCGIYPRPSPGGWQLIGRSDATLFDVDREPPALLTPGTRVRFVPQRPTARAATSAAALAQVARDAAAVPSRLTRRRPVPTAAARAAHPALEVLSPGVLTLLEDTGRPGRAAMGVSRSGAFDRGAMLRANLAVGNPAGAAVLEAVAGPLRLVARTATVVALSGARAPVSLQRADQDGIDLDLDPADSRELALALDPGDRLEVGPVSEGLRLVLAVRGGLRGVEAGTATGAEGVEATVLGSRSRDTLSGLGPAPLEAGDVLQVGPETGLDAVPVAAPGPLPEPEPEPEPEPVSVPVSGVLEIPVHVGPHDLGAAALSHLLATTWRIRPDSDRVGVRLAGAALAVPEGAGARPSEPMMPGAIQVPPSGLPVVFGPDHPTTGGYPVIAVVLPAGMDLLAQAPAGTALRIVVAPSVRRR